MRLTVYVFEIFHYLINGLSLTASQLKLIFKVSLCPVYEGIRGLEIVEIYGGPDTLARRKWCVVYKDTTMSVTMSTMTRSIWDMVIEIVINLTDAANR